MKITIIGAGNAGSTVAVDLQLKGHTVYLYKTSNAMHNAHYKAIKSNDDCVTLIDSSKTSKVRLDWVSHAFDDNITESELIIVFVQTNYHEQIVVRLSEWLRDGQIVLFEPGYLSTCYLLKHCNKQVTSVEAESSPIDCRITESGVVSVLFKNIRNPIGIYPREMGKVTFEKLRTLDYDFVLTESVIEAALHNPNLIVHTIGAVMSIPRIEYSKGQYWMYKEVFTPHVWNIVEELDNEKMNVLEKLGYKRIPYVEACKYRNTLDDSKDALEVFFDYANNSSPKGPDVPNSR